MHGMDSWVKSVMVMKNRKRIFRFWMKSQMNITQK